MTLEELRFIARQQGYSSFSNIFDEDWITDELLTEALSRIDEVFRNRLIQVVGVERKYLGQLPMPKLHGGYMKPGYANACYGIKAALRHLSRNLRRLKFNRLQTSQEVNRKLTCPHCGAELRISLTVDSS